MPAVTRQKVVAAAAVAVLLAGGAIAAVSATGQSSSGHHAARSARSRARQLATAAAYLGTSPAELSRELRAGKTLAEVAETTAGKSKAGLVGAIVAAEQRTAARRDAKRLARREQRLTRRAKRLVERKFAAAGVS